MSSNEAPNVMVAEYSDDTRVLLKYWLETRGCRVVEATTGAQAVELTLHECPDLILMSLRLPQLGGLAATRRIREDRADCVLPIVAMSTYPTEEVMKSALAAGCAAFIAQPVDFDVLDNLLERLLSKSTIEQPTPRDTHLDRKTSRLGESQPSVPRGH